MNQKKNYKKLFATAALSAATAAMVVPLTAEANSKFPDVDTTDYYFYAVNSLAERNIINGYPDGKYHPNDVITRGQAAKIIAGVLGLDTKNVSNPNFSDVPKNHPFYGEIAALANAGVIGGYNGKYNPNDPIIRNHMAVIIANAFQLSTKGSVALPFYDIDKNYQSFIAALYENGVTAGVTPSTYGGNKVVTRGQMAVFVTNAERTLTKELTIKNVSNNKIETDKGNYTVSSNLFAIFKESNAAALAGAKVKVHVVNNEVVSITSIKLNQSGTSSSPVVFDGGYATISDLTINADYVKVQSLKVARDITLTNKVSTEVELNKVTSNGQLVIESADTKVASSTSVAAQTTAPKITLNATSLFEGILAKRDNVTITSDTKIPEVRIDLGVSKIQIDSEVEKVTVNVNVDVEITGNATIDQLAVTAAAEIALEINGIVRELLVKSAGTKIEVGTSVNINQLTLPRNSKLENIISNYEQAKHRISKVVDTTGALVSETPSTSTSYSGGGTVQQKVVSGTLSITDSSITINGTKYTTSSSLASLFSQTNAEVLEDAEIKVTVEGKKIVKVTNLTIKNAGTFNAASSVINGDVTIDVDGLTVEQLTVTGDVILTDKVTDSINFSKVNIKGKMITASEQQVALKARTLIASVTPMAAEPVTRLKITFANSTVAFVEIKKVDTTLSIHGATQISTLALQSNASIVADPQVILPNLKIEQGVTKIHLNASIAKVEIESNDELEITGKGNFDEVLVKTDKEVKLNTEGTIKKIGSDTNNIQLGTILKVGETTNLQGEEKDASELISNYDDVQHNVNVEIVDDELEDYIAAKLIPVENRYGYATLSVINSENAIIKYRLVHPDNNPIVQVGGKAPAEAIEYNAGDEFIPWFLSDIHVYKVDEKNNVLDAYNIQNWGTSPINLLDTSVDGGNLVVKTIFGKTPIQSEFMYIVNGENFYQPTNLSNYKWEDDTDGIPTVKIPLPNNYNEADYSFIDFVLSVQDNDIHYSSTLHGMEHIGEYNQKDPSYLESLHQLAQIQYEDSEQDRYVKHSIERLLRSYAYEPVDVKDINGNIMYTEHKSLVSTIDTVFELYIAKLKEKKYQSGEEVKQMVVEINNKHQETIEQVTLAKQKVFALFIEDFEREVDRVNILAENTTLEKINDAQQFLDSITVNYRDRTYLQSLIHEAERLFNKSQVNDQTEVTLDSIAITATPAKTLYKVEETLDLTGLVVSGTYEDGSTQEISVTPEMVTGFDSSAAAVDQVITVTVDGKTTTFTVTITDEAIATYSVDFVDGNSVTLTFSKAIDTININDIEGVTATIGGSDDTENMELVLTVTDGPAENNSEYQLPLTIDGKQVTVTLKWVDSAWTVSGEGLVKKVQEENGQEV